MFVATCDCRSGLGPSVRRGHWRAVTAMRGPGFADILAAFNRVPEIGGAYFRVVERGFQPVDLHPEAQKPLMGIGGVIAPGSALAQIEANLPERVAVLLKKRSREDASREKQVEAAAVRAALNDSLRLVGFGDELRLIASQWRIELGGRGELVDLLAVDIVNGDLVVIELKPEEDRRAIPQASRYAEQLRRHGEEATRFFASLADAMGRVYRCADLVDVSLSGRVRAIAAWPTATFSVPYEVVRCL